MERKGSPTKDINNFNESMLNFERHSVNKRFTIGIDVGTTGTKSLLFTENGEVWSRIVADVTALPVKIPKIADLACVSAAILAGYGAGLYTDMSDGHRRFAVGESVVYPDPERAKMYSLAYENYKKHAEALGMIYKKQSDKNR